jgi:hypothetical protein
MGSEDSSILQLFALQISRGIIRGGATLLSWFYFTQTTIDHDFTEVLLLICIQKVMSSDPGRGNGCRDLKFALKPQSLRTGSRT